MSLRATNMHTLGIIGGGNMGGAIVRGCLDRGVLAPERIIVAELDLAKRDAFVALGCAATDDPSQAAQAETILLAVKPQAFDSAAAAIGFLPSKKVVISIMAGLRSQRIRAALGPHARMVRAMPNTPCQIGQGMTAVALGDGALPGDERLALAIFGAIGRTVVLDESHMEAVTAVSGSGPAYVFLLAEAMEKAAVGLGLPAADARVLVEQTILGAGALLRDSSQGAAALRQAVTSPGGTTAAALEVFAAHDFEGIVIQALKRARDRGLELNQRERDIK